MIESDKQMSFSENEFSIFSIEGLDPRMTAIRASIQPRLYALGETAAEFLTAKVDTISFPVHVAKHLRRTKYAPESTWAAIGGDKRGYKKYPHFQIAINREYVAFWLAFIDHPEHKEAIADSLINEIDQLYSLPDSYVISLDHTKEKYVFLHDADVNKSLIRFRDVKKGEWMIGRLLEAGDERVEDNQKLATFMLETFDCLLPFYQSSLSIQLLEKEQKGLKG